MDDKDKLIENYKYMNANNEEIIANLKKINEMKTQIIDRLELHVKSLEETLTVANKLIDLYKKALQERE